MWLLRIEFYEHVIKRIDDYESVISYFQANEQRPRASGNKNTFCTLKFFLKSFHSNKIWKGSNFELGDWEAGNEAL